MNESHPGKWWHQLDDGRVQCDLCPRDCKLHEGQRGFCFVRANEGNQMVLKTYGRSSGFCVDPIEKKPLAHFYPGSSVLSFGTAGCNLGCRFCQNWDISKATQWDKLADQATPEAIAARAKQLRCKSVAFTYNDPTIFAEYAIDVAQACREAGIKTVAVTAGYIHAAPRRELYELMDAANVDLKAFTEDFYSRITFAHLQPVLETIEYLVKEAKVWTELTTLVIPGHNDSEKELGQLSEWVAEKLGPDVPLHFSAFHPDFKMLGVPATPPETLKRARRQAMKAGLRYVYTGNLHDIEGDTTFCHECKTKLVIRDWYEVLEYQVTAEGTCPRCATPVAGQFDAKAGEWGRRRQPVVMAAP